MDTSNPRRASITTITLFSSTSRTQVPNSVLGANRLVCQTPLFFATTLAMPDYRSITIFLIVATLCDGEDTPWMVTTPIKDSHEVLIYQPLVGQIFVGNIHVDHLFVDLHVGAPIDGLPISQPLVMVVPPWHVTTAKFQKLPSHPPINRAGVLPNVVAVQNQKGVFQMKRDFGQYY